MSWFPKRSAEPEVSQVAPQEFDINAAVAKLDTEEGREVLKNLSTQIIKRFKQEIIGENEDLLDRSLRKFRAKVARRTWHVAQKWGKWAEDGPVLMPDYTRCYYRKGKTEVMVQEVPPQVRLMKFKGALAKRASSSDPINDKERDKVHNYSLALPYVVFIYRFVEGLFVDVYVSFSDRPLKKLQERPLRPYLSNLDSNLKLCHGASFDRTQLEKDNLTQQAAFVLSHFWQTVYSDEWSSHYWQSKKNFEGDNRLKDLESWQEASIDNSLFVIEDAKWLKHNEETYGDMIVRLFENDGVNNEFQQDLYKDLVDNFLDEVKEVIQGNLNTAEQKLGNVSAEMVNQVVTSALMKLANPDADT